MEEFAEYIVASLPLAEVIPDEFLFALIQISFALVLLILFVAPFAGIVSWVERRIAGRMMDRIGPNRVGPQGFLQWIADGIKCFLKEDVVPTAADSPLFRLSPYLVFSGMFAAFVAVPFSSDLIIADLNVGIFYILAITSIVAVGILMGGWASNNKWSLLGGMRSAAQIISYEIPAGISVLVVVLLSGTLSMQEIIRAQGPYPWDWFIFNNPFATVSFFILFISALAEGNRTPFDIPEADSELVAGYCTEYSGMRFVFFFFEEWANLYLIAAVGTTLFFGGWQVPPTLREWAAGISPILPNLFEFATFFGKATVLVFVVIWLRWTLPRLRVDQLMTLCWKYLIPIGFVAVLGTATWLVIFPDGVPIVRYSLTGLALAVIIYFYWRVLYQLRSTKAPINLSPFV